MFFRATGGPGCAKLGGRQGAAARMPSAIVCQAFVTVIFRELPILGTPGTHLGKSPAYRWWHGALNVKMLAAPAPISHLGTTVRAYFFGISTLASIRPLPSLQLRRKALHK